MDSKAKYKLKYPGSNQMIKKLIKRMEKIVANPTDYFEYAVHDAEHDLDLLKKIGLYEEPYKTL